MNRTDIIDESVAVDLERGVAHAADARPIAYDYAYWEKYVRYDATPLGHRLTELRVDLVRRHRDPGSCSYRPVASLIDVGIGAGRFVLDAGRAGYSCYGFDVNGRAVSWLVRNELFVDPYQYAHLVDGVTCWDSLEHLARPNLLLQAIAPEAFLFVALPICPDLNKLRDWKHYRPREHFWYWTDEGFREFVESEGFEVLECNDEETRAGREDIRSYACQKLFGERPCGFASGPSVVVDADCPGDVFGSRYLE